MSERHDARDLVALRREWERLGLGRRDFLRLLAGGASAATIAGVLAACGGGPATNTPAPAATTAAGTTPTTAPTATAAARTATTGATGATATAGTATRAASPTAVAAVTRTATSAGPGAGLPSGGPKSTLEAIGRRGGRVIFASVGEANTNNPLLSSDAAGNARTALQFNQLVNVSPDDASPYPDLAVEVPSKANGGISADNLTYTFRLRPGVRWHDGQPLTARDVVFTYQTALKPEIGSPWTGGLAAIIDAVTAPDDTTVVFRLKRTSAAFLNTNISLQLRIVPEHILGQVPVDQFKTHPFSIGDPAAAIGTGPFRLRQWTRGDRAVFAKNPAYFRGEPALDEIIYRVIPDANAGLAQLRTNEVDVGEFIPPSLFEEVSREQSLNVSRVDSYSATFYSYQLDPARTTLFEDVRVRQALAYAINREAMVRTVHFGLGVVAVGTMPPASWAYAPDQIRLKYEYDLNRANQLLDDAGWRRGADGVRAKDGQRLSFQGWAIAGVQANEQTITILQQLWRAIGVEMAPRLEERAALIARFTQGHDFELILLGIGWLPDPDQSLLFASTSYPGINGNRYNNPRVDALLTQGASELDQGRRKQIYVEMQNVLQEDLGTNTLFFTQTPWAVNKRFHNFFPNANNNWWAAHAWWVSDGR